MRRVIVVCEGQTEETFVRDILSPIFVTLGIGLTARCIQTSKGNKGGALVYDRVKRFICTCLKEDSKAVVTTFFDLYGLDKNFPDFDQCNLLTDVYVKVSRLEKAFKDDVIQGCENFANRFLPYLQPYEFEGLLFTDISKVCSLEPNWQRSIRQLKTIRNSVDTPEHINNGYDTKPSARLNEHLSYPKYRKTLHGPLAIKSIGIDRLILECKHFYEWHNNLIKLA